MSEANIRIFDEDAIVIQEGSTNAEMYRIVSGNAAIYFDYGKETEYLIGVLTKGRCFGEIGFLTGKPSPFSVVAVTDLILLGINANTFESFVSKEPKYAISIMENLANIVFAMSANVNMLKEEMLKAVSDVTDEHRVNMINKSLMKYRVSGLQGSPYYSELTSYNKGES